jgi:hypothetical protein
MTTQHEDYDTRRLSRIEWVLERLDGAAKRAQAPEMQAMWSAKVLEYQRFSRREIDDKTI